MSIAASIMTITVVIPAYNAGKYIARTIDSVLAQSRPADEIIVIDDGSTDDTAEQVSKYEGKVSYIHQQNAGASVARNTGIEAATGDWIAFLDGDDEWLPENLKCQSELIARNPDLAWSAANFICCYCDEDRKQEKLHTDKALQLLNSKEYFDDYFSAFIAGATGCTDTILIKRSVLIEAGLFTPGQPMANDIDMWWKIAHLYPQIGYSPQPLAIYHINVSGSITAQHRDPQILSDLIAKHLDLAKQHNKYEQFKPCARHMLKYWIHNYLHDDRITEIRKLLTRFENILPARYRIPLNILTISPTITKLTLPLLKKLNKLLRVNI